MKFFVKCAAVLAVVGAVAYETRWFMKAQQRGNAAVVANSFSVNDRMRWA